VKQFYFHFNFFLLVLCRLTAMTSIDRVPLKDVSNSLAITPVISALDAGDSGASPSTSLILESESVNNGLLRKPTEELPTTETIVSKPVSHDPCGFWRISGDLDSVREIDPGEDPAWLVDGCHQKYSTLQFRPSPSEVVMMTLRKKLFP
jgi:hypothetical protein